MADNFTDLLRQLWPQIQGGAQAAAPAVQAVAQSPPAQAEAAVGQALAPVITSNPAVAAATAVYGALQHPFEQYVSDPLSHLAQIPAGSLFGPLLAPPGNAPPIASEGPAQAAGYQVGRALGALLAGQGPQGVADVFGQGQQAWQQPEPIMGYKGVLEAPFNPLSYAGPPQGRAYSALAEAGVPGAARAAAANTAFQTVGRAAAGGLESAVGAGVEKLPWALGQESVSSQVAGERAGLQNIVGGLRSAAEQGLAPPEAGTQAFRTIAAQQAAATAVPEAAGAAAAPTEGLAVQAARAMGLPPETTPVGVFDQLNTEVVQPYIRAAHDDIDIARTAYKSLGLDTSQPLAAVIAQADQTAPPILGAIPQAEQAWAAANPGKTLVNNAQFNSLLQEAEHNIAATTPGVLDSNEAHWSTVLHWMQDQWPGFSPASQKPADVEALVLQRIAAERGSAPVHPAAVGMAPPEPTPGPPASVSAPSPPAVGGTASAEQAFLDANAAARARGEPLLPAIQELEQAILRRRGGGAPPSPVYDPQTGTFLAPEARPPAPPVPEAGPPVPGAAPVTPDMTFTTSQGSTYDVFGTTTQRTKAPHVGHLPEDVGLKDVSDVTYYLNPADAQQVGIWQTSSATGKRVLVQGDEALLTSINPATGVRGQDARIRLQSDPSVGLAPLELFRPTTVAEAPGVQAFGGSHPGTPIVEVRGAPAAGPPGPPVPEAGPPAPGVPPLAPRPWEPPAPGNAAERGFTRLYSEMSPDEAALLVNSTGALAGKWVSPSADLALGQGANRGALVEFAPEALRDIPLVRPGPGQQKPGVAMLEATGQGQQEWLIGGHAAALQTEDAVRTITLQPGVAPGRYGRRLAMWPSETLPDGSVQYTNPRFAPGAPPAAATAPGPPPVGPEAGIPLAPTGPTPGPGTPGVGVPPVAPGAELTETRWSSNRLGVDALYHETDPRTAAMVAGNPGGDISGFYLSSQPELALGQGGKGAVLELAPTPGLEVRAEMRKPGAAFVAEQTGVAPEFTVLKNRPSDTVVRSVTFDVPPAARSVENRRLTGLGWTPETLPDGRVRYTNPDLPAAAAAPEAAPPRQFDANGNLIAREGQPIPPESPPLGPSGAAGAPAESPAAGPPPTGGVPPEPPPGTAPPGPVPAGMPPETAALFTPDQLAQIPGVTRAQAEQAVRDAPTLVPAFEKAKLAFQNIQNNLAAFGDPPETIRAAQTLLKEQGRAGKISPADSKTWGKTLDDMARRYPVDSPLLDVATEDPAILQSWAYDRGQQLRASSDAPQLPAWSQRPLEFANGFMNLLRAAGVASGMIPLKYLASAYEHRLGFAGDVSIPGMRTQAWNALKTGQEAGANPLAAPFYTDYGVARPSTIGRTAYTADIGTPLEVAGTGTAGQSSWYRLRTWLKNFPDAAARTISDTVREGGFQTGYADKIAAEAPAFATTLADLLGPDVGGPLGEQFTAAQGKMAPGVLRDAMAAADVAPALQKQALTALADLQQTAYDAGTALMDKMAPGAVRTTNLDAAARYAIPFSTFASRQIPRTLELFLTNPAIWNMFRAYHEITDAQDKAEGRLPGTSLAQNVLLFKIGDTRVFINPLEYLAEDRPFRQPFTSPKQAPVIGDLYNRLSQQGFGLAGPLGLVLTSSGMLGPAPPPELTELDSLLSNALSWGSGQQITMPWTAWANQRSGGKPALAPPESVGGGAESFDPALEVRKRLGEMSLEETGRPDAPAYRAAMTNPADPLYIRAVREVHSRELIQEALHLIGAGVRLSPASAGDISRGMAGIPQVNAAGPQLGNRLLPILPYPNAAAVPATGMPGGLMTNAQRQALLFQRALAGQPAALGYQGAYAEGSAEQPGGSSEYQARVDKIRQDFLGGTPERQYAMWADPRTRGVVLDLLQSGKYNPTARAATPSGTMQLP